MLKPKKKSKFFDGIFRQTQYKIKEKVEIKAPSKGKEVTQKEYDEIVKNKMEEMREMYGGKGGRGGRFH